MGSETFFLPAKTTHHKSKMKCTITTFFDQGGLVYTHAVPDGRTVNADYWYVKVLKRFITVHTSCKRLHYCNDQWKLHHDNVMCPCV